MVDQQTGPVQQQPIQKKKPIGLIIGVTVFIIIVVVVIIIIATRGKKEGNEPSQSESSDPEPSNPQPSNPQPVVDPQPNVVEEIDDSVDESNNNLNEIVDDIQQPVIDTTDDNTLKQFSGFTTIADNKLTTTVDIDKVAYLSPNGKYKFSFQNNNNLVIFEGSSAVWNSDTASTSNSYLRFEQNGNLAIYELTTKKWESSTTGGGQFLVFNDKGQLLTLSEDGEVIEFIIEYHTGNANLVEYMLNNSDVFRAFSSSDIKNNHTNPGKVVDASWNLNAIVSHYINSGRMEGRTMNYIGPQNNIYNMDGKTAHACPKLSGWKDLKDDQNRIQPYMHIPYISYLQLPLEHGGDIPSNFKSNAIMLSVPIDVVKFYHDFKNPSANEVNAQLLITVDDRADIILNDKYIKSLTGDNNDPVDLVLAPGKNRIMIVLWNTGGPGAFQALVRNRVTNQWYTSTINGWRYINDLTNILGYDNGSLVKEDGGNAYIPPPYLHFNKVDNQGRIQFHYHYMNTTGKRQKVKFIVKTGHYCVLWVERKLINSKSYGADDTPFYCIMEPGKNAVCFEVMSNNTAKLNVVAIDEETSEELFDATTKGWRLFETNYKPGPFEKVIAYYDGSKTASFWIGQNSQAEMEAKGLRDDKLTHVNVPKCLEAITWNTPMKKPNFKLNNEYTTCIAQMLTNEHVKICP